MFLHAVEHGGSCMWWFMERRFGPMIRVAMIESALDTLEYMFLTCFVYNNNLNINNVNIVNDGGMHV